MYYSVGKLAILKLRDDYNRDHKEEFSLQEFHDRLLSNGNAPLWVHRQMLLPGDKGKKDDLKALQVTQTNIDELSQALQDFKATKEKPRSVTAGRAAETESLASLIRDANGILRNQIDRLVNLFRRSNPKFVAAYRSARVIVDRPATHASPKPPVPPPQPNP